MFFYFYCPRSPADNESGKSVLDAEEQSVSTLSSNHFDDQPDENGEASRDEIVQGPTPHDENNRTIDVVSVNDHDEDEEMKRVLQQQEQLIDQFQAEENAQREWEEKYNENKSSMLVCTLLIPSINHACNIIFPACLNYRVLMNLL